MNCNDTVRWQYHNHKLRIYHQIHQLDQCIYSIIYTHYANIRRRHIYCMTFCLCSKPMANPWTGHWNRTCRYGTHRCIRFRKSYIQRRDTKRIDLSWDQCSSYLHNLRSLDIDHWLEFIFRSHRDCQSRSRSIKDHCLLRWCRTNWSQPRIINSRLTKNISDS